MAAKCFLIVYCIRKNSTASVSKRIVHYNISNNNWISISPLGYVRIPRITLKFVT